MNNSSNNTLITVVGPTAIGKTALAIQLAKEYQTEIISCDSRQFFKEMQIGTAVPNPEELAEAQHHFIQNKSIFDSYNVGEFEKEALGKLNELFKTHKVVIMAGGSGLYVDAVLNGLDYFPKVDPKIREDLNKELQEKGIEYLQEKLKEVDVESYTSIAIANPQRLIRALEISIGSGTPFATFKNKPKAKRNFKSLKIGITAERPLIYERINKRVDLMMANGLLEEAKKLYAHKDLNALQTVGYKELFRYFDGDFTQEFAVSEIKKNTRRFAKRQLTWFNKDENIIWFNTATPKVQVTDAIAQFLKNTSV